MEASPICFQVLHPGQSHFVPGYTSMSQGCHSAREMFPHHLPSSQGSWAQGYFCDPFQHVAVILVAHVGGRHEVVHLHLPSLSDPAAPSPSSSPGHPRNSIPFSQGSYHHYAHADCEQVSLPCPGPLCLVILAQVV